MCGQWAFCWEFYSQQLLFEAFSVLNSDIIATFGNFSPKKCSLISASLVLFSNKTYLWYDNNVDLSAAARISIRPVSHFPNFEKYWYISIFSREISLYIDMENSPILTSLITTAGNRRTFRWRVVNGTSALHTVAPCRNTKFLITRRYW